MAATRVDYQPIPFVRGGTLGDLMYRRSQHAADAELMRGQLAAQQWANIGNTIGGAFSAYAQEKQQAPIRAAKVEAERVKQADEMAEREAKKAKTVREQALDSYFASTPEPRLEDVVRIAGPTAGAKALKDYLDVKQMPLQAERVEADRRQKENALGVRRMIGERVAQGGPIDAPTRQQLQGMALQEGVNLGDALPPVPKEATPPQVGSFEDYVVRRFGPKPLPEQITQARKDYQQADDRPRITVNTGSGMSPTMEANVINRLTTQWGKAVAPVAELSRQVKLMDTGMEAVNRGDMAQGSQVILTTFQKILDPPSVVRESEYMRSAAGQSMMNRVKGAYDRLVSGGAGVTKDELQKFATLARQAAQAQASGYVDAQKERIGKTADRFKIPRDLVFEDFSFAEQMAAPPATPAAGKKKIGRFDVEVSD